MPSWEILKQIVRVTTVLAIVAGATLFGTWVRDDWVGAAVGFGAGLVLGLVFVYVNWPALDE